MPETGENSYAFSFYVEGNERNLKVTRVTKVNIGDKSKEIAEDFYIAYVDCDISTPGGFYGPHCREYSVITPNGNISYFETLDEAIDYILGVLREPPVIVKLVSGLTKLGEVKANLD